MEEKAIPEAFSNWINSSLTEPGESVRSITPLRVEASHRSFYRVQTSQRSLVGMQSPPDLELNDQFVTLADVFCRQHVPVPQIQHSEKEKGWYLMTDLGAEDLEAAYQTSNADVAITAAIHLLPKIAATTHPSIAAYDAARLHMELGLFHDWFATKLIAVALDPKVWTETCALLVDSALSQPTGCVHRDYHCRNILFNQGKLGIVDFQDALQGPILYDIASLLRDCYHVFDESEIDLWLDVFIGITPSLNAIARPQIKQWFDWIAIQRQLKAIGIFARLHLRDGKSSHLAHISPVLERLKTLSLTYPELRPLDMQLETCINALEPNLTDFT